MASADVRDPTDKEEELKLRGIALRNAVCQMPFYGLRKAT